MANFSEKEIAFLRQAKAKGMDKNKALSCINNKRQQATAQPATAQPAPAKKSGLAQKSGDFGAGLAQGLSDVGQRTALRPVSAIMESGRMDKMADKLAKSAFGQRLRRGAANIFGEEELRKYQEAQGGKSFSESVKADKDETITKLLVGEERADSGAAKFGRGTGQFVATTALTAPIGWALGALGKVGSATTKLGALGRGAAVGGSTGAAGTQVGMLGMADRAATAKETLTGVALGGAIGGIGGLRTLNKSKNLIKMLTEKTLPKNVSEASNQGRIKFTNGLLKSKGEITPTERVANAVDVIKSKVKIGSIKNPQKLVDKIDDIGRGMYKDLSSKLKQINVGTMTKNKSVIKKQIAGIIKDSEWNKFFRSPQKQSAFKKLIADIDTASTADDLWKVRVNFDKLMKKPSQSIGFQGDTLSEVWQDVRTLMNNNLDDIVSAYDDIGVKAKFYDMSSLLEAGDNLSLNMPNLIKEVPTLLSKAAKRLAIGGGSIGALSLIRNSRNSSGGGSYGE